MKTLFSILLITAFCSCDLVTRQQPPEEVVVKAPVSNPLKISSLDSSCLVIAFSKKEYVLTFMKDTVISTDTLIVKKFINQRAGFVNHDKVFVKGNTRDNYETFKPLKNILKDFSILRFKLITAE